MHCPTLALAVVLLAAGCSSTTTRNTNLGAGDSSPSPTNALTPVAECKLQNVDDLIAWYRTPGNEDAAQILGDVDVQACKRTVETFADFVPKGEGYCAILARPADNPGYDADARPARRPSKPLVEVGPAC